MPTPKSVVLGLEYKYAKAEVEEAIDHLRILRRNAVYLDAADMVSKQADTYADVIMTLMDESMRLLSLARDRFEFIIKERKAILVQDDNGGDVFSTAELEEIDEFFPQSVADNGDGGTSKARVGSEVSWRFFSDPYTAKVVLVPEAAVDRIKADRLSKNAGSLNAGVHLDSVDVEVDTVQDRLEVHNSSSLVGVAHGNSTRPCCSSSCQPTKEEPSQSAVGTSDEVKIDGDLEAMEKRTILGLFDSVFFDGVYSIDDRAAVLQSLITCDLGALNDTNVVVPPEFSQEPARRWIKYVVPPRVLPDTQKSTLRAVLHRFFYVKWSHQDNSDLFFKRFAEFVVYVNERLVDLPRFGVCIEFWNDVLWDVFEKEIDMIKQSLSEDHGFYVHFGNKKEGEE